MSDAATQIQDKISTNALQPKHPEPKIHKDGIQSHTVRFLPSTV